MKRADITIPTSHTDIKRNWYHIDVSDKVLGRVATEIAEHLIGKQKPYFVRHLDCGDYVVVTNVKAVKVTGNKATDKVYTSYSGFPGGIRSESFEQLSARHPEEIIRRAVSGMLPKNKLRAQMMTRLYIYPGNEHPYSDKFQPKADRPLDDKVQSSKQKV